ncbi:MAG: hypothetical protein QNL62_03910 [Gammaproteobacteria bacterium]|nr:hypothetical protein [Gammaproteobacteria bacterium]
MLDSAKKQIEFLNLWFASVNSISDNAERVQEIQVEMSKEIEAIKNRVTKSFLDIRIQAYTPWKQRGKLENFFS